MFTKLLFINFVCFLQSTPRYHVTIVATDNGDPRLSNTTTIIIAIDDINEHAPEFSEQVYQAAAVYTVKPGKGTTQQCVYLNGRKTLHSRNWRHIIFLNFCFLIFACPQINLEGKRITSSLYANIYI